MTQQDKGLDMTFDKIAILSRGYGRSSKGFVLVDTTSKAEDVGDEPLQLKRRLNKVHVAVDEKRVHGIKMLLELAPKIHTVILDDAFQHRYVKPNLSILLTSYQNPFYKDCMLPMGRLREPRKGYKRARLIMVTNAPENMSDAETKSIVDNISPRRRQRVFFSTIIYQSLMPVFKSDLPVPAIGKGFSVVLLTGIANPGELYKHLTEIAKNVIHIPFPDHHIFKSSDIAKVMESYNTIVNPDKVIITTEKDAMRLQTSGLINSFGTASVFYIPIQVKIHKEERLKDSIISNLSPLAFARLMKTVK
jgi:tetraacyldisaccharide 4'-kinase